MIHQNKKKYFILKGNIINDYERIKRIKNRKNQVKLNFTKMISETCLKLLKQTKPHPEFLPLFTNQVLLN